jgi:PilZ domain.
MSSSSLAPAAISLSDSQLRLVERYRHNYGHPDLDDNLMRSAPDETISGRFLVKMEIARLAKKCCRVIDFRDSQQDSVVFEYDGIKHYINEQTKEFFLLEAAAFKGYTHGVYEAVIKKARNQKLVDVINQGAEVIPDANYSSITRFYSRKEQRLYCVSAIEIYLSNPKNINPERAKKSAIEAMSTDISPEGMCIKTASPLPEDIEHIYIRFTGFENEFTFTAPVIAKYDVLLSIKKNGYVYYKIKLSDGQFSAIILEFLEYLKKYIYSQTRRYKVPIENTQEAVIVKGYEQYVIGRLHTLPVFIRQEENEWVPDGVFLTPENNAVFHKFYDEKHETMIKDFIAQKSIQQALKSGERFSFYFLFSPVISPDNYANFICIPISDCVDNKDALSIAKLAYAKSEGNLLLFRIEGMTIDPVSECHIPSSLPDSTGEVFQLANKTPIERAKILASGYKRMITISDESDILSKINVFSEECKEDMPKSALFKYIPHKALINNELHIVRNEIDDKRMEPRFSYKMPIHFHTDRKPKEVFSAFTVDVSTKGMQLEIKETNPVVVGDVVTLDFPSFANQLGEYLISQPYRVVSIRGKYVHLCIYGNPQYHDGRKLMKKVIWENMNSLDTAGCRDNIYGLSRVVRNLFAFNHPYPKLFIKRLERSRYISDVAVSKNTILPAFSENDDENYDLLQLILKHETFTLLLNRTWAKLKREDKPIAFHILATVKEKPKQQGYYISVRDADELIDDKKIKDFFEQSSILGNTRLLRIVLSRKNKVFNKYFRDELHYLARYAPNRAKMSLDAISQIDAVGNLLDVTDFTKELF